MKKTLFALAMSSVCAGAAFAQSTVSIYGVVDAGIVHESGNAAGTSVMKLTSGVGAGSRLGFKGSEALGGGMSANFLLENGFNADVGAAAQGGLLFGRQAWVGLDGGYGSTKFGRQYTPYWTALVTVDPFAAGYAGVDANLMASSGVRMDNSVKYSTPNLAGFSADLAYGFGEVAGNASASRALGLSVNYVKGPLTARVAHHRVNNAAATDSAKNTMLTAVYDFGPAKTHFAYAVNKGVGSVDNTDLLAGLTVPFGAGKVMLSYIRKDDKSAANADANQIAAGYVYSLSKRTSLYTSYARIDNRNGAFYTVGSANGAPGSGSRAINAGVTHTF